jgi:hypothetical protein
MAEEPPLSVGLQDAKVSGAVIQQHRSVIADRYGAAVLGRTLGRMPRAAAEQIESAISVGWVSISAQEALYDALSSEVGRPVPELHAEVARLSTGRNLRTLWRLLLRVTTDQALVARAPILFARSYAQGTLSARMLDDGHAELVLSSWPRVPEFTLRGVCLGVETVLRAAGRRDPRVTAERTAHGARFDAVWKS